MSENDIKRAQDTFKQSASGSSGSMRAVRDPGKLSQQEIVEIRTFLDNLPALNSAWVSMADASLEQIKQNKRDAAQRRWMLGLIAMLLAVAVATGGIVFSFANRLLIEISNVRSDLTQTSRVLQEKVKTERQQIEQKIDEQKPQIAIEKTDKPDEAKLVIRPDRLDGGSLQSDAAPSAQTVEIPIKLREARPAP